MLKVHGLEAALVDNSRMIIGAMEETDTRVFPIKVAGPTALLISKTIKLSERVTAGALERAGRTGSNPRTRWTCFACSKRFRALDWLTTS